MGLLQEEGPPLRIRGILPPLKKEWTIKDETSSEKKEPYEPPRVYYIKSNILAVIVLIIENRELAGYPNL